MVVLLLLILLILILLSKTIRLSFIGSFLLWPRGWSNMARDSEIWKDSQMEQISANGLTVGALAFKI